MKMIIDIPEEHYRTLQEAMKNHMESLIGKIVLNGTVLPKHGRLIDADAQEPIIEELENILVNSDEYILDRLADLRDAPTILEPTVTKEKV